MQQKQQDPFYPEYQQPTNFRFASNRPASQPTPPAPIPRASAKHQKKSRRPRRRRIFTWWNLFAVIGIVTVIVQTIRYVIVPLLVMLEPYWEKLMGGAT